MNRLARLLLLVQTLPSLGLRNVLRVGFYRLKLLANRIASDVVAECPPGEFFSGPAASRQELAPGSFSQVLFGWHRMDWMAPPDWQHPPLLDGAPIPADLAWPEALSAVAERGHDVKIYWEMSRFSWVPELAGAAGDGAALARLNEWLRHWVEHNRPYRGLNWACGQEASIRVMNLALAVMLLQQAGAPSPALVWMLRVHLARIYPTLGYAIGQANNHGAAEAAALFIGGTWLMQLGAEPAARRWARVGEKWLVDRVQTLIQPDGSGNQYSTTYHRANLEVFCLVELWRRQLGLPEFPPAFSERVLAGGRWLHQLTDRGSGDAPNMGPNDGSHLFSICRAPYRDFRPTVQLVAALFDRVDAYADTVAFENRARLFRLQTRGLPWAAPRSRTYTDGGLHVLRCAGTVAYMRYPRFRFRPGHADGLHLDLWINGINLLRDAGTFSYVAAPQDSIYFNGAKGHNTIEFDDRDQMPRLGRFLYGPWLNADRVGLVRDFDGGAEASAGYTDRWGAAHCRSVQLREGMLRCVDQASGAFSRAVLRWRLAPGEWELSRLDEGVCVRNRALEVRLVLTSSAPMQRAELIAGWESRFYMQRTPLPVFEVEVCRPCTFTTEVYWSV